MSPSLVAIAGSLEGTTFMLAEEEVSIGRDRSNQIWLNDLSVSRRHCVIQRQAEQFKLVDLESHNGTRVNGVPMRERVLASGDLIAIGDSVFTFLLYEEAQPASASDPVQFEEREMGNQAKILLRKEEAIYLNSDEVLATLPPTFR